MFDRNPLDLQSPLACVICEYHPADTCAEALSVIIVNKSEVCASSSLTDGMGKPKGVRGVFFSVDVPEACINSLYPKTIQSSELISKRTEEKQGRWA